VLLFVFIKSFAEICLKIKLLTLYTLASLNYTLSVSEYVTTNVTTKPVAFLHGTNNGCTVVSHMCTCNTLKAGLHWGQARLRQAKLSMGKCLHLQ